MSEQEPGAAPQVAGIEAERKTTVFAVRVDPVLREQIEGLRGITGQSVNEVGIEALTDWVTKTLADGAIRERAMADIDAEARRLEERRAAISGILGQSAAAPKPAGGESGRSSNKQDRA